MVNVTNRNVVRSGGAQIAEARCCDCRWTADSPLTVRSDAGNHVKVTGHEVMVETKQFYRLKLEEGIDSCHYPRVKSRS